MIVQRRTGDGPARGVAMTDHLGLADQFAEAFGNEMFEAPGPSSLFRFAVAHHDQGWSEVDQRIPLDDKTGLPCNLLQTPIDDMLASGPASAAFNEAYHPWCGLLVSMHVFGLYNGRYGLSDKIVVEALPEAVRPRFDDMLADEVARQERLKATLGKDPEFADSIEPEALFQCYRLLQFFDTLALYFCMDDADLREQSHFLNVPSGTSEDATVTVTPLDNGDYRVHPFPFAGEAQSFSLAGKVVSPQPAGTDIQRVLHRTPTTAEQFRLVS